MKLGSYIIMIITMMVFLEFLGISTGISTTLEHFGITINEHTHELMSADLQNSGFFSYLFNNTGGLLIVLVGGSAVIVGLFARSYDTSLVILPFIVAIATLFASTSWSIIKHAQLIGEPWITGLTAIIFIPIGIGFIMSAIDYFVGR
jgi:hypothetical protein